MMNTKSIQPDVIETLGGSTIQHGKYNDRIYLMKADLDDIESIPKKLKEMARERDYSKIFAKVPAEQAQPFLEHGFGCAVQVPRFYLGEESALMLSYFLKDWRCCSQTSKRNLEVMDVCRQKQDNATNMARPDGVMLRMCEPNDADTMAKLYDEVFPTYPFPIGDPAYIRKTMATHIVYFGIWMEGKLVALSSAEMDGKARNVEMTDFATLPDYRGQGLAAILLDAMEAEMRYLDMATAYTIARAPSFGMNITFARMGYRFAGRLINNTNISGQFEDMNVWYKPLVRKPLKENRGPTL